MLQDVPQPLYFRVLLNNGSGAALSHNHTYEPAALGTVALPSAQYPSVDVGSQGNRSALTWTSVPTPDNTMHYGLTVPGAWG